jgi:hypothetical protein
MQAFFGGDSWKDEDPLAATGGKTRAPLPFPQAISVGLSCAVDGSKAALGRPSDAWKPLTAATVIISVALDGVGFYAASQFLRPGDDAGMIVTVFSKVALVAVDGAWVFVAPLLAIAIVQQVLPLLGEKILFDALKASAGMGVEDEVEEEEEGRKLSGGEEGDGGGGEAEVGAAAATWSSSSSSSSDGEAAESASSSSSSSSSSSPRTARVRQLEDSGGLGLRGLGVAASKAQSLGGLGAAAVPVGLGLSFFIPVFGPIAATALATAVAAYTLAWELLDPYFDKAGLGFEQQEKVGRDRRIMPRGSLPKITHSDAGESTQNTANVPKILPKHPNIHAPMLVKVPKMSPKYPK